LEKVDVPATRGTSITGPPMGCKTIDIDGTEDGVFRAILRNTEPFNLSSLPEI
jgi:hypothetical protein